MSVAPPEGGRNPIMIYGPKPDGTYIVEFKTTDGEALAISVPAGETSRAEIFPRANAVRSVRAGSSLKEPMGLTISPGVLATGRGGDRIATACCGAYIAFWHKTDMACASVDIRFQGRSCRRSRMSASGPTAVIGRIEILQCSDLPPHSSLEGTD